MSDTIDIKTVEYDAELITEKGTHYLLNDALLRLEWEEQAKELAQRATLTVANFKIGTTYLMALMKINCVIRVYGKWNGGNRTLVFEGTVWEWQYVSSTQKELTVTAYDMLIRLQQSKDFKYYSAGMTTQGLIGDVCGDWNVSMAYTWEQSLTHEKKVFNAERISDIIIGLLEEVRQKTGEKYTAGFRDGKLQITGIGTNKTVYRFDGDNTMTTTNKLTINNLVTRVKIIGKQNNDGRAPVDAIVDGDTKYGVLQEIVRRDSDKTVDAAKSEAAALLKERGKPEEVIRVNVPDLPFLRKGDKVEISAGNLIGFFIVAGVAHNGTIRQMTLTLDRV
jgi:hypothetical protein